MIFHPQHQPTDYIPLMRIVSKNDFVLMKPYLNLYLGKLFSRLINRNWNYASIQFETGIYNLEKIWAGLGRQPEGQRAKQAVDQWEVVESWVFDQGE